MLEALKVLEGRRSHELAPSEPIIRSAPPLRPALNEAPDIEPATSVAVADEIDSLPIIDEAEQPTPAACCLGVHADLPDCYFDMAVRIGEQMASNYCNVLLFVTGDHAADAVFSMPELARAFALQSPGQVLLVDGDLRYRRMSKSAGASGPGMVDVMRGTAPWSEVIRPSSLSRVAFVSAGHGQVPTLDRPEFGWHALRPQYRAVLIGLSAADEPEIGWLSARCDGVYFVLSRPHSRRQGAVTAINTLRAAGANVLGSIVVND
jgi:Mrp family chromosome partitioning ATPase